MHGPLTDPDAVAQLRHALQSDSATEPFEIVLYTSNGKFHNYVNKSNVVISLKWRRLLSVTVTYIIKIADGPWT